MTRQPVDHTILESRLRTDPSLVEVGRRLGSRECWVVGGWVRDRALEREPPDLDLVVRGADAAEEAAATLGAAWGTTPRLLGRPERAVWRLTGPGGPAGPPARSENHEEIPDVLPEGRRRSHPSSRIYGVADRTSFEICSRERGSGRASRCKVEIWPMEHDDLEADALRRDFTCNALFWCLPDGPLFDPSGGMQDLADQRIRAISRRNLAVDPVRLLRGIRLTATLEDFTLDPRSRSWIADLAPTLTEAPRERVGAELLALAQDPGAAVGLRAGAALGLLGPAGPQPSPAATPFTASLDALTCLAGEACHPAPAAVAHNRPQAILAWLASGWPPDQLNGLSAFAWPRNLARSVAIAASRRIEARTVVNQAPADRREFIARCGQTFPTVLALAGAIDTAEGGRVQPWRRWWRQWTRSGWSILQPKPLLSASEVATATGIEPGPRLGRILEDLERAAVRRAVRTPQGARRWLRRYSEGASSEVSSSA